jgi:hypothetical protein
MLGHNVPDEFFKDLEKENKLFLSQKEGKLILADNTNKAVVLLLKKTNADVNVLTFEERELLNFIKIPIITIGSSKHISEIFIPNRYFENAELENRPFLHGLFDCYTLLRDYYKRNFDVYLPTNIQRNWEWWAQGENLYVDNAKDYSFEEVSDIQKHDVLIMKIGSSMPNHGAVYLGEGKILHHLAGRFSTTQDLTLSYKQKIAVIYRNKILKNVD